MELSSSMAFSIQTLAYANGDGVEYTYNQHGQVTEQVYEDGASVVYRYDNSGTLAQVEDSDTGILNRYYYDLSGRLVKYLETGGGQEHSVLYSYDTIRTGQTRIWASSSCNI